MKAIWTHGPLDIFLDIKEGGFHFSAFWKQDRKWTSDELIRNDGKKYLTGNETERKKQVGLD